MASKASHLDSLELGAHGAIGGGYIFDRGIDKMQQHAAALDVTKKARAQAGACVRALDQPRHIG